LTLAPFDDLRKRRSRERLVIEAFLEPGVLVRHPGRPDWGVGQVQSVDDRRVTINFEEAGKQTVDISHVNLTYVGPDPRADNRG
jgi:hypothetical protein